ncbi:MAG: hypothetical protein U0168_16835 [Nannocystaceae bacterium]
MLKSGDVLEFGPFRVEVEFTAMPAAAPMGVTVVAAAPSGPPVAMATMAPSVGQTQMAPMGAAPMAMPAAAPCSESAR